MGINYNLDITYNIKYILFYNLYFGVKIDETSRNKIKKW